MSFFGNDSKSNGDASGVGFHNLGSFGSFGGDASGANTSGADASGANTSGADASGADASGVGFSGFGGFSGGASGTDASGNQLQILGKGLFNMMWTSLVMAGVILFFYVLGLNLSYLSKKINIQKIPTNKRAPPYDMSKIIPETESSTIHKILYGYGAPYNFNQDPAVFSFVPCDYSSLRSLFGIKKWFVKTLINSWAESRGVLKAVLKGLRGLPEPVKVVFGFLIMSFMVFTSPLVSLVFTLMGSFKASVGWSILGILTTILPIMIMIVSVLQHFVLIWYLFLSPLFSEDGRKNIKENINKKENLFYLSLPYLFFIISYSFFAFKGTYHPFLITFGMMIAFVFSFM